MTVPLSPSPSVGFVGLTHLGLVTSSVLSSLGIKTICFDSDPNVVRNLQKGNSQVLEPGLDELLQKNNETQIFTTDIHAFFSVDLIYISTDVPTDKDGMSNPQIIIESAQLISRHFPETPIVILSQVTPGFTRKIAAKIPNPLYYQVETLIFGKAVERSKNQTRIIIGARDDHRELHEPFANLLKIYSCPILVSNYETAELTKVSINSFLASDVVLTNTLAELSEKIGANWNQIVKALILDQRIGTERYLKPGLGISGGNIERDLRTIVNLGHSYESNTEVIESLIGVSAHHKTWVQRKLSHLGIKEHSKEIIGILGLAYKKDTNSIKNSPAIEIIQSIPKHCRILIHDPVVKDFPGAQKNNLQFVDSIEQLLTSARIIIISTPWDEYQALQTPAFASLLTGKIVVDPYGVLDTTLQGMFQFTLFQIGKY